MKHTQQGHLYTEIILEAFKLSGLMTAEGDKLTAEFQLSSARWKILGSLVRSETPLTVPQIARVMGQTRQAVQRLVDIMHKDGLVELHTNPAHKRAKLVALSGEGQAVYSKLDDMQVPWANQLSSELDADELETTLAMLKKISQRFET